MLPITFPPDPHCSSALSSQTPDSTAAAQQMLEMLLESGAWFGSGKPQQGS